MLACHAQQKFPAATPAANAAAPKFEFFESKPSGLDDKPTLTDLSSLNAEAAGAHGFIHAERGHFIDDRGTRVRIFGVNLSGAACLPDRATASRLARHFRKLGFNAVRLHALDAPGALLTKDFELAHDALERLDHFGAELKAQGLYFSFGLHAAGGYPGLSGAALASFPHGQVLDRFHAPFLEAQRALARALLTHVNPETQRKYSDEPALLYLELNDEDSIFPSWAGGTDDLPPSYRAELAQGYAAWVAERTANGLRAPRPADEEAEGGLPTFHDSASARADYAQYLAATETRNVGALASFIRGELGLHSMLIDSQASFGGLAGVLREATVSDFVDMHGYWDQPHRSGRASGQFAHWPIQNAAQVAATDGGTLGMLGSYRVFGKPFTVSEFAVPAPSDYAVESFPLLVGIAGLQDWDGLFAYAYADQKPEYEPDHINGVFDLAGHPAKLAFVTMAASSFRRGLVAPGQSRVELNVPDQPSQLPFAENALPALWAEQGVPASAVAVRQMGITLRPGSGEVSASEALTATGTLGSDTGQLLWERAGAHPRFSIDAPALKLVCGQVANSVLQFTGARFEFADFAGGYGCASLLALDDQPIATSRRMLLTVAGRAENAHRPDGRDSGSLSDLGGGPVLAQYVPLTVALPASAFGAAALDATGEPSHAVTVSTAGESKLTTSLQSAALSYAITR